MRTTGRGLTTGAELARLLGKLKELAVARQASATSSAPEKRGNVIVGLGNGPSVALDDQPCGNAL